MDGVGAMVWLHALLQGLRRWPALEVAQLFFWWLILLFLLGWTLLLARARLLITAEEPLPSRPSPPFGSSTAGLWLLHLPLRCLALRPSFPCSFRRFFAVRCS